MNIAQLEYLVATVEHGSYAAAAKTLFVSPTAVSQAVNDLEKELGVKFVSKRGRGIEPTELGVTVAEEAINVIAAFRDLKYYAKNCHLLDDFGGVLKIAICTEYSLGTFFRSDDFEECRRRYPNLELEVLVGSSEFCIAALLEGVVDLSIFFGRINDERYICRRLFSFSPWVAALFEAPIAERGFARVRDLKNRVLAFPSDVKCVYTKFASILRERSIFPNFESVSMHSSELDAFLKNGGAILVAKNSQIAEICPSASIVPFSTDDRISVPICVAYRKNNLSLLGVYHYLVGISETVSKRV